MFNGDLFRLKDLIRQINNIKTREREREREREKRERERERDALR